MLSRSIKQFSQCKSTIKSVIYFTTELKEGLENLNESRRFFLVSLALKKTRMSSNKDFLPSRSPISFYMRHRHWSNLFPFHDELLQVFITRMYYNYRIENRAYDEPAAILFTSATRKHGIPPPPVGLSWDSPHPPPESVRTEVRWRQNQDFSDQCVNKFAYTWCSASSAINSLLTWVALHVVCLILFLFS